VNCVETAEDKLRQPGMKVSALSVNFTVQVLTPTFIEAAHAGVRDGYFS